MSTAWAKLRKQHRAKKQEAYTGWKTRKQRKQKAKAGSSGLIDKVKQPKPGSLVRYLIEAKALAKGDLTNIEGSQEKYRPTSYEAGHRAAQSGEADISNDNRQAKDGYANSHKEQLKFACHLLSAKTGKSTTDIWRMRRRLAAIWLYKTGQADSQEEAKEMVKDTRQGNILLAKTIKQLVENTK